MLKESTYKHRRLKTVEYIARLSERIGYPHDFDELWGWSDDELIAYRKKNDDGGYYRAQRDAKKAKEVKVVEWLPENYKLPETESRYMRLDDGKNRFRIVSSAVVGWEWWVDTAEGGRKPMRVRTYDEVPDEVKHNPDDRKRPKHFWAFVIWDYNSKSYKIMEVTQKTIMAGINALVSDDSWGNPQGYDITITRTGKDLETKYTVMPSPKKEFKKDTAELASINLEALYDGDDPFVGESVSAKEIEA